MSKYNEALDDVMAFADTAGTIAHSHFFTAWGPLNGKSADYWSGQADAFADTIEQCNRMRRIEHGSVAGTARRLFRSARVRLGL